jgi:hypothetical protein
MRMGNSWILCFHVVLGSVKRALCVSARLCLRLIVHDAIFDIRNQL